MFFIDDDTEIDLDSLKILLISCQKLGLPAVTKSLAFYFYHRLCLLVQRGKLQSREGKEGIVQRIMASLSLAMKINEHVKRFKEYSGIVLGIMEIKEIVNLKDEMMIYELLLQEDIYFIQEWDSPFRFLLKIVRDLGGDERLGRRAWKITNQSFFTNICIQVVPQAIAYGAIYLAFRLEKLQGSSFSVNLSLSAISKYFIDLGQVRRVIIKILRLFLMESVQEFVNATDKSLCAVILDEIQERKSRESSSENSHKSLVDFPPGEGPGRGFRPALGPVSGHGRVSSGGFSLKYKDKRSFTPTAGIGMRHHSGVNGEKDYRHSSSVSSSYRSYKSYSPEKRRYSEEYDSRSREYDKSKKRYSSSDSHSSDDKKTDKHDRYYDKDERDHDKKSDYKIGDRPHSRKSDYKMDDRDYNRDKRRSHDQGSSRYSSSKSDSRYSTGWNNESSKDPGRKNDKYRDDRYSSSRRDSSSHNNHSYYSKR